MPVERSARPMPSHKRVTQPFPRSRARNPGSSVSLFTVSKGIDIYGFLDPQFGDGGITLYFYVPPLTPPTDSIPSESSAQITGTGFASAPSTGALAAPVNVQVDSGNLGFFDIYGTFYWDAWVTNKGVTNVSAPLFTGQFSINPFTGNSGGSMTDLMNTPSYVVSANTGGNSSSLCVSYGFYDAGPGYSGLPDQDQFYLYVSNSYQNWMGNAVDASSSIGNLPLSQWCLPGAHDAGMCTMATVYEMIGTAEGLLFEAVLATLVTAISSEVVGPFAPGVGAYAAANVPVAIQNLAITQKDSIAAMLASGIRYFDFRPGYMYGALPSLGGALFHQHKCIPGYAYVNFLTDILSFCAQNPSEIVVINLNDSGFMDAGTMSPSDDELNAAWLAACPLATSNSNSEVAPTGVWSIAPVGGTAALAATYNQLINGKLNSTKNSGSNQAITSNQIVFLYQMTNASAFAATKWDSYSDPVYATLDPQSITNVFQQMSSQTSTGDYTVLQCQGTASNIPAVATAAIVSPTLSSSPLMATKPAFDSNNLGWIWNNGKAFSCDQLLVILNDFADNATTATAIEVNTGRIPNFVGP